MKVEVRIVTPTLAAKFLESNIDKNRDIAHPTVSYYTNQMLVGEWKQDGNTIKFDKTGALIDGQHRLSSIIKSGKSQELIIVKGLDEDVFAILDSGKQRTLKDILSIAGVPDPIQQGGAARTIMLLESKKFSANARTRVYSPANILNFINDNPNIYDLCRYGHQVYGKFRGISPYYIAALYYIFEKRSAKKAEEFFKLYTAPKGLEKDHPVLALRRRLQASFDYDGRLSKNNREKVAMFIIAWNHFLKNKPLSTVNFNAGGEFPKPL